MKRSLLALAVLGAFAGAASAQSSVTIYGIIDMGISKSNDGTSNLVGSGRSDTLVMQQGYQSRLGFRGIEDLGGGLRAAFNLEHRFTPDNGTSNAVIAGQNQASQFWFGRSTVALQGNFGEVILGRDYVPAFWVALASDPFNWNTIGQLGALHTMAGYGAADGGTRNNNNLIYKSPVIAGGLTASVAGSLGEGAANRGGVANLGRAFGANIEYKAGPIYVGGAIDQTENLGIGDDPQLMIITGSYDFGIVKPTVSYARNRTATAGDTTNALIGANVLVGAVGVVHVAAARLDPEGNNNNTTKVALGYEHLLSKRTSLYADVASAKTQSLERKTGFDVGLTHKF